MRKLRYGAKNDMKFGDHSGAYRCHSCGHEKTTIEDVRMISTDGGPEVELTLSCEHCTTLSIFQITSDKGHLMMGVIAHAMNTRDDTAQLALDLQGVEWP